MAIVKGRYTRSTGAIKASVRYIMHRPGKEGERISRTLFGFDGPMEKEQAYKMMDEAPKGTYFYRLVLSTDPRREDLQKNLNLWKLTEQTMRHLEDRLREEGRLTGDIQFIAAEHNDHTDIRHVHALVLLQGRLDVADFQGLRTALTAQALSERQQLDQERGYGYEPSFAFVAGARPGPARGERQPGIKPLPSGPTCPACGPGQTMKKLKSGMRWCPSCSLVLAPGYGLERGGLQLQLSR
jgi:hypothetical protein